MSVLPHPDSPRPKGRLARRLLAALGVMAALTAVWLIRIETWPCGALDRTSGCVSSVKLDVAALGLDPETATLTWNSFDLAAGGNTALVGIIGSTRDRARLVLAIFDTETGAVVRVLEDKTATSPEDYNVDIADAALSPDGLLAAATVSWREGDLSYDVLAVYSVTDGSLLKTLAKRVEVRDDEKFDCLGLLDFSADGAKLQCFERIYDLVDGGVTPLPKTDGQWNFPILADSVASGLAPDGTTFRSLDVDLPIDVYDGLAWPYFAPDSVGLLTVSVVWPRNIPQQFYLPAVFRQNSAVILWNSKTKQAQRSFYSNRRYVLKAWSRDSAWFGFVTGDLRLEVFKR
jgi:hypothetical protein